MKKLAYSVVAAAIVLLGGYLTASAASIFQVVQGGTGVATFNSSQILYGNGTKALSSVATTSVTCSGSTSCTGFTVIGSSPVTISSSGGGSTGLATTSPVSGGNLLEYSAAGAGSAFGIATSSETCTSPLSCAAHDVLTGGGAISLGTVPVSKGGTGTTTLGLSQLLYGGSGGLYQSVATSTVTLGLGLGGTTVGVGGTNTLTIATSSLYTGAANTLPYFSGTNTFGQVAAGSAGFVLAMANGTPTWVATSSINNGVTSITVPQGAFTGGLTFATATSATNGITSAMTIVGSGSTLTFTPSQSGTLTVAGGGTGVGTFTSSQLIYGNGTTNLSSVATTTLTGTAPIAFSQPISVIGGSASVITCAVATGSVPGCLAAADFATFAAKQAGGFQISTTSSAGISKLAYFTGASPTILGGVATSSESCSSPLSCGAFDVLAGGGAISLGTVGIANGGTATTTMYNGGVNFYNSTLGTISQGTVASDFFYDVANKRLGLGTSTPFSTLSVTTAAQQAANTSLFAVASTTGASLLNVLASGNVGVGTTTPNKLFMVEGNQSGGVARIQRDFNASAGQIVGTYDVTLDETGGLQDGTGPAQTFSISNNGLAGNIIGDVSVARNGADNTGSISLRGYLTGTPVATGALTVDGLSGKVGIGTTTPSTSCTQVLCIAGGVSVTNASNNQYAFFNASGNTGIGAQLGTVSNDQLTFVTNNTAKAVILAGGNFGVGTTSPGQLFSIGNGLTSGGIYASTVGFAVGSSTPTQPFSVTGNLANIATAFYITTTGEVVGYDAANAWNGRISPTRSFVLGTATTTSWLASTTSSVYSPYLIMPFTGTLRQVRCSLDASFLGVNVVVNGSNAAPSYFVASTTVGVEKFTSANTFTAGQKILVNFGTTTSATTASANCTFDVTETP